MVRGALAAGVRRVSASASAAATRFSTLSGGAGSPSSMVADVVVVGGGHAGCEAAAAAARTGAQTLLVTQNASTIGEMACNPSIGGVGKGHLVREIDALDGLMARCADEAGIHFRVLNRSRGPAVRGPRAQADRELYKAAIQKAVSNCANLTVVEAAVEDLILDGDGAVSGVVSASGQKLHARSVVLTAGTFLRGTVHIGRESRPAGRFVRDTDKDEVEPPTVGLAATLERLGLPLSRLKTGTPPRLDGRTIDWEHPELVPQPSEDPPTFFAYEHALRLTPLAPSLVTCVRTATNSRTHELVASSIDRLPAYESGGGEGLGPRYCPSIHTKVQRFPERSSHVVWLEPEGLNTHIVYPNGISGAYDAEVQQRLVHSIAGLERAEIVRPGYDVEYDFIDPRAIHPSLEVRACRGLFLAGQIIGTTGYEEAAALGLAAGINAARRARMLRDEYSPFVLGRSEAYLGVLIDDLVSRGTMEPYRMFTSRAEYRLLLRADNADARLTRRGAEVGVVSDSRMEAWEAKRRAVEHGERLIHTTVLPAASWARVGAPVPPGPPCSAAHVLRLHEVSLGDVELWMAAADAVMRSTRASDGAAVDASHEETTRDRSQSDLSLVVDPIARETVEVSAKYAEALAAQRRTIERVQQSAGRRLPADMDYAALHALSTEEVTKLSNARPRTLQEASEISGITPSGMYALLLALREYDRRNAREAQNAAAGQQGSSSPDRVRKKQRRKALWQDLHKPR